MNQDEIVKMAREAGWMHDHDSETGFVAEAAVKFAALVAAHERERCAEMCDMVAANSVLGTANECATAIRGLK